MTVIDLCSSQESSQALLLSPAQLKSRPAARAGSSASSTRPSAASDSRRKASGAQASTSEASTAKAGVPKASAAKTSNGKQPLSRAALPGGDDAQVDTDVTLVNNSRVASDDEVILPSDADEMDEWNEKTLANELFPTQARARLSSRPSASGSSTSNTSASSSKAKTRRVLRCRVLLDSDEPEPALEPPDGEAVSRRRTVPDDDDDEFDMLLMDDVSFGDSLAISAAAPLRKAPSAANGALARTTSAASIATSSSRTSETKRRRRPWEDPEDELSMPSPPKHRRFDQPASVPAVPGPTTELAAPLASPRRMSAHRSPPRVPSSPPIPLSVQAARSNKAFSAQDERMSDERLQSPAATSETTSPPKNRGVAPPLETALTTQFDFVDSAQLDKVVAAYSRTVQQYRDSAEHLPTAAELDQLHHIDATVSQARSEAIDEDSELAARLTQRQWLAQLLPLLQRASSLKNGLTAPTSSLELAHLRLQMCVVSRSCSKPRLTELAQTHAGAMHRRGGSCRRRSDSTFCRFSTILSTGASGSPGPSDARRRWRGARL